MWCIVKEGKRSCRTLAMYAEWCQYGTNMMPSSLVCAGTADVRNLVAEGVRDMQNMPFGSPQLSQLCWGPLEITGGIHATRLV